MKNILSILLFFSIPSYLISQDCILYTNGNFSGDTYSLNLGENSINIDLPSGHVPSWIINNEQAAIQIDVLQGLPDNYPFALLNCAENSTGIGGGDAENFEGKLIKFSCLNESELPQPTAFLPIDGIATPAHSNIDQMPSAGTNVLVLKRAFLWLNSEDLDCQGLGNHGPFGAVSIRAYETQILGSMSTMEISDNWDTNFNFGTEYNDFRLPGPVYEANNSCFPDPNPESEWIDGPWGGCYSNIPIFVWDDYPNVDEIFVLLREGDSNPDDYMGGQVVNKNEVGKIIIRHWRFGWVEVENIQVPNQGVEKSVDIADYYWLNSWNGNYPDDIAGKNPSGEIFSQYLPLSEKTIDEMEGTFPENSIIGLMGGKFPIGTLNKPMIYVAPCEAAIFNE